MVQITNESITCKRCGSTAVVGVWLAGIRSQAGSQEVGG